jgi:hypothetical protein
MGQFLPVLNGGHGMQIGHKIVAGIFFLQLNVLPDSPEEVTDVQITGRLYSTQDPLVLNRTHLSLSYNFSNGSNLMAKSDNSNAKNDWGEDLHL